MIGHTRFLLRDVCGSVLVEVSIMLPLIIFFMLGSVDLLFLFYEWNAATKATQIGARIAVVSNPVMTNLNDISASLLAGNVLPPGTAVPPFRVVCDGATSICVCDGICQTGGIIGFDSKALDTIIYGRGSMACGDATFSYTAGMCDIFSRIAPENVRIEYIQPVSPSGLGYVGRPGGPVPIIKISLQNISFRFFFLGRIFENINIPPVPTTMSGGDLYSCSPMQQRCNAQQQN